MTSFCNRDEIAHPYRILKPKLGVIAYHAPQIPNLSNEIASWAFIYVYQNVNLIAASQEQNLLVEEIKTFYK